MSDLKDRFEITQDGKPREIFMSFGLLNTITALMGDPAVAASVYFNPELREAVLITALHERSKTGKIIDEVVELDDLDIPMSDIEALLAWEVDHAISFFVRSMERVKGLKGQLESLTADVSSLNGLQASPSKKPSSGRSK
ncbi:hypothetical protein [Mesorhizobium sp. WSM2239]|uniref:Tail assembly chaperone n=2 Tax=unclassified Mesorhizobium TaxID=325217 RepID=A0AAU8DFL3_9HYPH